MTRREFKLIRRDFLICFLVNGVAIALDLPFEVGLVACLTALGGIWYFVDRIFQ